MKRKFYVTTPIYYPNDIPHVGHAYTTIAADLFSRWNKLLGKEVFFLTGTDDHGKKIAEISNKNGKTPKEFTDELIPKFKEAWEKLNINYDRFIRTTDKDHEENVKKILQKIYDKGDIYLGEYEGLYCTDCESYYTEKDLIEGCCPIHKKPIEKLKEKSYFFKLSKYQDKLLKFYKENEEFILPNSKKQEVINRVKEGLRDLSISRTSFDWGIPLSFDKKHVCYVWFDALFNYHSGVLEKDFWPADLHLIGKDILWFHVVYWPAFLMAAGIELPKKVFAHGWWTFDKEKISKSRGKVINIDELVSIAGSDSARYFLLRATAFGDDGDFSEKALIDRHNGELLNKLGNLVSRVTGLVEKNGIEKTENSLAQYLNFPKINELINNFEIDKSLNNIFSFIDICNEYVQRNKPWETKDKKILYELIDSIKKIAIVLYPFIPETSEKISQKLGGFEFTKEELEIDFNPNKKIEKGEPLFQKIEENQKTIKEEKPEGIMTTNEVNFEDWSKLDLRIAEIEKVEDVSGADKLYKISLDVGELGKRIICAGLKPYYKKEELKGKKISYFSNLKPRNMKGIQSQGMLLAASSDNHEKVILISPEGDIPNGSRIG